MDVAYNNNNNNNNKNNNSIKTVPVVGVNKERRNIS